MLLNIHRVNNVRNLKDFRCTGEFLKKNVIFALNGSGKTNLSRFFYKFEKDELTLDEFNDLVSLEAQESSGKIQFDLQFSGNYRVTESNLELPQNQKILVYNKEFLDRNITINDFSEKDHSGKINIGKITSPDDTIASIKSEIESTLKEGKEIKGRIESGLEQLTEELRKKYKAKSTTFSEYLNFRKLSDAEFIKEIEHDESIKESENQYSKVNDINEKDIITSNFVLSQVIDFENLSSLLLTKFDFKDVDSKIENHVALVSKSWIGKGLDYQSQNEFNNQCPFCLQSLEKTDIISQYTAFIESLKSKTLDLIEKYITELSTITNSIKSNEDLLKVTSSRIKQLNKILGVKRSNFKHEIREHDTLIAIQKILTFLEKKRKDISTDLTQASEEISEQIMLIETGLKTSKSDYSKNNIEIQAINSKLNDLSKRKGELRKQIAQFNLLKYYQNNTDILEKRSELLKKLDTKNKELVKENDKGPSKEKKELIIRFMNKLIKTAGVQKYEISDDFGLLLKTQGEKVYDISKFTHFVSEGEKSVIAFSYYIASTLQSIERFEDIDNLTLFIDDPLSSNSYNYLHGIGTILKSLPELYSDVLDNKNDSIAPQVFVLTHNLQFYNFLAGNVYKKKSAFFNLELNKDSKSPYLKQVNNNRKLSEYLTSLKRVYEFANDQRDENVGSDIRKVLETICSFHFLELKPENIKVIFEVEPEMDLKLIADDYTHTDFNNYEDPLTLEALKKASNCLLKFIKEKYNSQYIEIERICKN